MFPKINEAFAKPLHVVETTRDIDLTQQDPDDIVMDSDMDHSVMDISSETNSSSQDDDSEDSTISIL